MGSLKIPQKSINRALGAFVGSLQACRGVQLCPVDKFLSMNLIYQRFQGSFQPFYKLAFLRSRRLRRTGEMYTRSLVVDSELQQLS